MQYSGFWLDDRKLLTVRARCKWISHFPFALLFHSEWVATFPQNASCVVFPSFFVSLRKVHGSVRVSINFLGCNSSDKQPRATPPPKGVDKRAVINCWVGEFKDTAAGKCTAIHHFKFKDYRWLHSETVHLKCKSTWRRYLLIILRKIFSLFTHCNVRLLERPFPVFPSVSCFSASLAPNNESNGPFVLAALILHFGWEKNGAQSQFPTAAGCLNYKFEIKEPCPPDALESKK